ncbi:B-cell antigen receptor complex-associated protein alpha chain isoform X1 [Stigmatopora argus]
MATVRFIFIIYSMAGVSANGKLSLEVDRPWLRVHLSQEAMLECCYRAGSASLQSSWLTRGYPANGTTIPFLVPLSDRVNVGERVHAGVTCRTLTFSKVELTDSGLYQCWFNNTEVFTPGTYLQVYTPLKKTINLSERTKDGILVAEGILLFLCVLVPSAMLLCKSKQLHYLQEKRSMREKENIYQGLNLDDSDKAASIYQDLVANIQEEIQLENA